MKDFTCNSCKCDVSIKEVNYADEKYLCGKCVKTNQDYFVNNIVNNIHNSLTKKEGNNDTTN